MNTREMIDSGVEWLGETPKDWTQIQLKYISSIKKGKPLPLDTVVSDQNGTPYINGGFKPSFYVSIEGNTPAKTITMSSGGASAGFCQILSEKSWIGSDCHIILPTSANDKYFVYWVLKGAEDYRKFNQTGTAMPHVNKSDLSNFVVSVPPLPEQQSIANFLDHHVSLIDREASLIDKKIELLGEKRKALIFECVTGKRTVVQRSSLTDVKNVVGHGDLVGVPTDPEKMMDSGVEWIGEIPRDWTVEQLKNIATVQVGKTPSTSNPEYFDGDIPWLTISDLKDDGTFPVSTKKTLSKIGSMGLNISPKGSVLVSFKLSVGKSTIAERDIYTNEAIATISPKQNYSNIFFYWSLPDCFYNEASENIYGAKILNQDKIHHIKVVLPLKKQQEIISKFLDYEISMIDKEISLLKQKQDLLVEKRKALIFEAVTGKFDCHSWTA